MAKKSIIKVLAPPDGTPPDLSSMEMISAVPKKVVCVAGGAENVATITYEGKNLDVESGMLVGGTITKITLATIDGEVLFKVSNASVNAAIMSSEDLAGLFNDTFSRVLFGDNKYIDSNGGNDIFGSLGDDLLLGRGGSDRLDGSYGKDVLVGGGGNDNFVFELGMGKDTIRDFDASGGNGSQDLIESSYPGDAAIIKSGKHDTIVNFGDGDKFLLLDVKPNAIDESDFI